MNLNDLYEGAIDKLEARRIEDLEAKMDDLAARAKQSSDPKVKEALRHEFAKAKAERDSYYKLNVEEVADTNYTYTVYIDGTKEGTYGSKEEAKAVVNRKKEQAPGRDYRIKPKARTSMASIKRFNRNRDRNIDEHGGGGVGPKQWHDYVKAHRSDENAVDEWLNTAPGESDQDDLVKVEGYASSIAKPEMFPLDVEKQWKIKIRQLVADYIKNPQGLYNIARRRGPNSPEAYAYNQILHPTGKLQMPPNAITFEGWQDFNKVEPYEVCLAGKPVKQFDYYEEARRFHDNWKKKLYREGNKEKADKITLNPILKEFAPSPERDDNNSNDRVPNDLHKFANLWWNAADPKLQEYIADQLATGGWTIQQVDYDHVLLKHREGTEYVISDDTFDPDLHEDAGTWIVYDPKTKQIKKRFKTHTAGKSYAKTHNLGFASSEYYFDNIKPQETMNEDGQVDPIILKALERIRPGIKGMGGPGTELYTAAKEALALEYGLIQARNNAPFINNLNKLQDLYLQRSVKEGSMAAAAHHPDGPKFGGYWKGTDKNPPKPGQGFGGMEESEEMEEGIAGNMTARSNPLTQPLRKRNFVAKNAQLSGAGKHNNNLKAAAARGNAKHKGQAFELDEMTNDEISKLRKDAEASVKSSLDKQSDARISALKNPPKEKSFMQKVGDKQIGMVKGAWKGLTGQLEESDNFLSWAVRNGYNINKPAVYESAKLEYAALVESKKKTLKNTNPCWKGYHPVGTKEKNGHTVPNCVPKNEAANPAQQAAIAIAKKKEVDEDWQKANKKDKTDGMSQKAVNAYKREHPGSKLKTAVTTKPSKLKKGSKASKRRKSFCARSNGQKKMHNIDCSKTPDKAICKARRRWNCEGIEHLNLMLAEALAETKKLGTRVQVIKGSESGQTGTIGEIRPGSYKGAPGYYTVDLDNGGHIQLRKEALRVIGTSDVEEGWKSKVAGAALAGAAALGASGAHARVMPGDDPNINRFTGAPVTQTAQADATDTKVTAPGFSREYLQKVANGEHPRPMLSKEKAQELLSQMSSGKVNESLKNNEYYVWTVYFDDGSSKRIKVKSDEFDPYSYYAKQNKVVVNVDYSWDIHQ